MYTYTSERNIDFTKRDNGARVARFPAETGELRACGNLIVPLRVRNIFTKYVCEHSENRTIYYGAHHPHLNGTAKFRQLCVRTVCVQYAHPLVDTSDSSVDYSLAPTDHPHAKNQNNVPRTFCRSRGAHARNALVREYPGTPGTTSA